MAAKDIAGHGGDVDITTATMDEDSVCEWSATVEQDEIAIPPAFGAKWEGAAGGAWRCRGALRGKLRYDDTDTAPWGHGTDGDDGATLAGTITLTAITGCTITGPVIFLNVAITRPHTGGTPEWTADFRNSDATFAVAWDVTGA